MGDVLPIINGLELLRTNNYIKKVDADLHCKVFEDNSDELEMARIPKM